MRMPHIFVCVLSGSTVLFHFYLKNGIIFGENFIDHKMYVLTFSQVLSKHFSFSEEVREI